LVILGLQGAVQPYHFEIEALHTYLKVQSFAVQYHDHAPFTALNKTVTVA
jgi:hypothetical protein